MRNLKGQFVKGTGEGFKKGHKIWLGKNHSEDAKRKISIAKSKVKIQKICSCGKQFEVWPARENRAKYCSMECHNKAKIGRRPWNKELIGYRAGEKHHWYGRDMSGEKNPSWKGGPDFWKQTDRRWDSGYQAWRMKVGTRDGFKCRIANVNCDDIIEVHHILPWRDFPELRYEVNNGITLCHIHHPRVRMEEKRLAPFFQGLVTVSNVPV